MTERENALRAILRCYPRWIPDERRAFHFVNPSLINDRAKSGCDDWFGVHWIDATVFMEKPLLDSLDNWESKITFPDLDALDWEKAASEDCKALDRENKLVWVGPRVGLFERMHSLLGFENALVAIYTQPEETIRFVTAFADFRLKLIDKIITYYQPDIVSYHDDYGTQTNLFFNPELFHTIFKPQIKRIVDYTHSRGTICIFHNCGKVDSIVDTFVELGFEAWDSVQPCCDLDDLVKKYGKNLSFTTSMDIQKVIGREGCTPEEAAAEVRRCIDQLSPWGGVIPRPNQPGIQPGVIQYCFDEIERYGKDYYLKRYNAKV